jgi:hypothetical protein
MRAKVCYTLLPKLYHKCKPVATNRSAFPRRPRASSPHRRCTKSDRSHDSSRVQGELRSALRHTLDPAAPTACDRDSVHRLPTLAEAHSARDDEDSAPPSPPALNSTRNVSSSARKHEALTGGSLPFEAVIARNTIANIEARLRSSTFQNGTRLLRPLATATPCTACPLLPKHTLRATMKIPLLRPRLHQIRRVTLAVAQESMKRSREVLFPFEAAIARNAIPSIEAHLRSPHFHDASRWLCTSAQPKRMGRVPSGPLSRKGEPGDGLA